jgi:radical SAM-linked protein
MSGAVVGSQGSAGTRHRITFGTARTLAYVSVLELGTIWERTLRRARVPLAYSQGYNPRPRMHFAAPLPVGCGGEAELLDALFTTPITAEAIVNALAGVTPQDLTIVDCEPVADDVPSLSEQLTATEYEVLLRDMDPDDLEAAVERFLDAESVELPRRGRRHRGKTYDLRPLVKALCVTWVDEPDMQGLWMRLNAQPGATGRPDEVLKALKLNDRPRRCTRTRLTLSEANNDSF